MLILIYSLLALFSSLVSGQEELSVSVLAGAYPTATSGFVNGIGTNANFFNSRGVSISSDGTYALVADCSNHAIRQIIITTASVSLLAGSLSGYQDGIGTNSKFNLPYEAAISPDGSYALVTDNNNHAIHKGISSSGESLFWYG